MRCLKIQVFHPLREQVQAPIPVVLQQEQEQIHRKKAQQVLLKELVNCRRKKEPQVPAQKPYFRWKELLVLLRELFHRRKELRALLQELFHRWKELRELFHS